MTFARTARRIPCLFAHHAALLLRDTGTTGLDGAIPSGEKEMIIVATSGANGCLYLYRVVAQGATLRVTRRRRC